MFRTCVIGMALMAMVSCQPGGEKDRVEELLAQMTLEEKVGQLNQYTSRWEMTGPAPENDYAQEALDMIGSGRMGSMLNVVGAEATRNAQELAVEGSRLGIPLLFGYDVIHGYRTMFPVPLGEAATWEPELARQTARAAAVEASAAGLHWTFAPMVDIARDARWGRIVEGSGEDPYLGEAFARARVRGFQGDDLASASTIAACAKHFAGYGFVESGKDYNTVELTEHTLQNVVLPPFRACIDEGVATFMNAFNEIGGVPSTANHYLVRDLLKGAWGFEGFVVSDWNSVGELIPQGVAADRKDAARLALEAGCDMDMEGYCYVNHLEELVEEGTVDEALLDDAVRRILRVKEQLGLFEDPYRYCSEEREKSEMLTPEHIGLARDVARRSLVLLKNEGKLLPLKGGNQRIALIGDLAADKDSPLGSWRAQAITGSAVSVLEGMQQAEHAGNLIYERGPRYVVSEETAFAMRPEINTTDRSGMTEAVNAAARADVVVVVLGENCFQSAEAKSVADIRMKGLQEELLNRILEVNSRVVLVLMNGRPLDITAFTDRVPAVLVAWQPGSEAGHAIADVLYGEYNPSGRLPVSWPRSVGQLPIYYNHKNTGRPVTPDNVFVSGYTDESNDPLFPFGYGISYTSFEYSALQLSDTLLGEETPLEISVTVTNKGDRFGEEVVQLYTRDLVGSVTRPVRELKGFRKIGLEPGASEEVVFGLSREDLEYFGLNGTWGVEPGTIRIWVGPNAAEGLEGSLQVE
ncbi:MAG: beta-glucosidase BglX [Bacteroidales bacterium]